MEFAEEVLKSQVAVCLKSHPEYLQSPPPSWLRTVATALDGLYNSEPQLTPDDLVDDFFQTMFLASEIAINKGNLTLQGAVQAVHRGWVLAKLLSRQDNSTIKFGSRTEKSGTVSVAGALLKQNRLEQFAVPELLNNERKLQPNNSFVDTFPTTMAILSLLAKDDVATAVTHIAKNTLILPGFTSDFDFTKNTLITASKKLVGIMGGGRPARKAKKAKKAKKPAAAYKKTARKHCDSKGVKRTIYKRSGFDGEYIRKKSASTGKLGWVKVK